MYDWPGERGWVYCEHCGECLGYLYPRFVCNDERACRERQTQMRNV